jgi:serine/threonine-protein kinase
MSGTPSPSSRSTRNDEAPSDLPTLTLRPAQLARHEQQTVGDAPTPASTPAARLGRFEVFGEIGRGGMGAVLRGRDPVLGRDLALKVLHAGREADAHARRRFQEEAQIGGQLQHPGLVPVYELGADGAGRPFFAMKLIDGRTLSDLLKERKSLTEDLPRYLTIFEQVCQTLAYAHARGVIHRDLKPSNIMVGAFGEVQVMDWGLAKVLAPAGESSRTEESSVRTSRSTSGDSASVSGSVLGTPAYMPPEQARGEIDRLDERADVFGLGAILCVILTGKPPFPGQTQSERRERSARGDLNDAFAQLDGCGADENLVRLAKSCLAARSEDRPRDGAEAARLVTAHRAETTERLRRAELERTAAEARAAAERRRRQIQLALAGVVLLLVVVIGGAGWYVRQQQLQHDAEQARQETERVRRQVERNRAVESGLNALADERLKTRPDWNKVQALLARVEGRLEEGGDDELRQRVQRERAELARVRRDQEMVGKLEEARLQFAAVGEGGFDPQGSRRAFADAFAWYGLDVGSGSPEEAAARLRTSSLREELTTALDRWASVSPAGDRKRLLQIADGVDDNAWRRQLRAALLREDHDRIRRLADEADVAALPPASSVFLAAALREARAEPRSIPLLREGRRLHPADLWLNFDLALALQNAPRPQAAEAVRYLTAAQILRPDSAGVLVNLGIALKDLGQLAEARRVCAEAVHLKPDYPAAHNNLGVVLQSEGKLAAAIVSYREAIRLDSTYHPAHSNLGHALAEQGKLVEALAASREALRLKPDFAFAHNNLGIVLKKQGKLSDAVAAYKEAIKCNADFPQAHNNLGLALHAQGKVPEATAAFREAVRINPDYASGHYNLGVALEAAGRRTEAETEYREAIRLKPEYAEAHCNLGVVLRERGELEASLESFRKGHELGGKTPGWRYPSAEWLREATRLVDLERRLPDVLDGKSKPADGAEQIEFAGVCILKRGYLAAVILSQQAYKDDARLADDLDKGKRYNAACAAALAAAGKDAEGTPLDRAERAQLRSQALQWLRADLAVWVKRLDGSKPPERAQVAAGLHDWQEDGDLASVRDAGLTKLPKDERNEWQKLWKEVEEVRKRAADVKEE